LKECIMEYNIYCDESCHLENDGQKAMVLGAVWCPKNQTQSIFMEIRNIKKQFGFPSNFEIKWNKVSPAKFDFYSAIIDYFFNNDALHFRTLVVPDKSVLNHIEYNQTHDDFYYKMYFDLLKIIFSPNDSYYTYLDIKDTQGQQKVDKLKQYLRSSKYDYNKDIIKRIQQIRSNEVELLQITDLLIGAVSYLHRGLNQSTAKVDLIKKIQFLSGYSLMSSTLVREPKMNIFIWHSGGRNGGYV
jgi:hypothetical protein